MKKRKIDMTEEYKYQIEVREKLKEIAEEASEKNVERWLKEGRITGVYATKRKDTTGATLRTGIKEVSLFPKKRRKNGEKKEMTAEEREKFLEYRRKIQAKANARITKERYTGYAYVNFGEGDIKLDITFPKECIPKTKEEFRYKMKLVVKAIQRDYRKKGMEVKRIHTEAWGEGRRAHVHMLLTKGMDRDELEQRVRQWFPGARCQTRRIEVDKNTGVPQGLVEYILADKNKNDDTKRICHSANLLKPEEEKVSLTKNSAKKVAKMAMDENYAIEEMERQNPGYRVESIKRMQNEVDGEFYIKARLIKELTEEEKDEIRKKREKQEREIKRRNERAVQKRLESIRRKKAL